ncbi:unnamed protein product [Mycena citricolor]|uniref:Uncharacterized protein n=1 Tax=Mycena citricolor TaxID=2018698 RepID=A0AAD2HHT8_9AGAR|nr:unnamed protein product [Mycena citricolor]
MVTSPQSVDLGEAASRSGPPPAPGGVQPLPKGAMAAPTPGLSFAAAPELRRSTPTAPVTPPADPSQRLLDGDASHGVQFASYPAETPDEKTRNLIPDDEEVLPAGWVPTPLQSWYAITLVVVLLLLAIVLEVMLHITQQKNGWKTHGNATSTTGVMHYVYSLPPVIIAAVIVALWAWTDIEIKKMQPYVDLAHGDAPPHKSLLLDYTRSSTFFVWSSAIRNRHWCVTAASIMVLVTLTFQPLTSALLSVKNTWVQLPDVTLNTISTVGLNQSTQFNDLTGEYCPTDPARARLIETSVFLTAAGYASATVGYNLQEPPFVFGTYTVTPFNLPYDIVTNGTVITNTTAIRTNTNCVSAPVQMTNNQNGTWTNTLQHNGCSLAWTVDHRAITLFGTSTPDCGDPTPPQFQPVIFWFFTYDPSPMSSATFCTPAITLWNAQVTVDLGSGNVTSVVEMSPFTNSSPFGSLAGNLTGAPLNGRAYNGINFTLANPDGFVLDRLSAIQLTMPAAVFQAAVKSSAGLQGSFTADLFVNWSNDVYNSYLTLIAKAVYFLSNTEPITMHVKTFQLRLWMNAFAVHVLTVLLILLAIAAAFIHIVHRWERQDLNLLHQPGTIASAVSIGADTGMGQLLAQHRHAEDIQQVLRDKRFRIDPFSNKIVMDGEEGYEVVGSPVDRRLSVFAAMQGRRASRRFSRMPVSPSRTPPRSPMANLAV